MGFPDQQKSLLVPLTWRMSKSSHICSNLISLIWSDLLCHTIIINLYWQQNLAEIKLLAKFTCFTVCFFCTTQQNSYSSSHHSARWLHGDYYAQWWCSPCSLVPGAVNSKLLVSTGFPLPWGPCRLNLATRHLGGNYTVTAWVATRYPITHSHCVGITVAQIHGFVAFH